MTELNLSREERIRFFEYCTRESEQYKAMAEQMKKLSGNVSEILAKREKQKAVAYAIVAQDIDPSKWEGMSIKN